MAPYSLEQLRIATRKIKSNRERRYRQCVSDGRRDFSIQTLLYGRRHTSYAYFAVRQSVQLLSTRVRYRARSLCKRVFSCHLKVNCVLTSWRSYTARQLRCSTISLHSCFFMLDWSRMTSPFGPAAPQISISVLLLKTLNIFANLC